MKMLIVVSLLVMIICIPIFDFTDIGKYSWKGLSISNAVVDKLPEQSIIVESLKTETIEEPIVISEAIAEPRAVNEIEELAENNAKEELYWVKVGAIGQCTGAFATFVAVCVALWQTRYPFRKKLKLSFNSLVMATAIDGISTEYAVAVNVINAGKRPVTITEFSIMHKDDSRGIIFQERQGIFSLNMHMPITIEADRNIDLYFLAESFVNHVAEMIEKKNINENKKIKFRIRDTTGKEYFVKTFRKAKDYSRAYWR